MLSKRKTIILVSLISINLFSFGCPRRAAKPDPTPTATATVDPSELQPKNAEEFFKKMAEVGYTKKKEEITADLKKILAIKIANWDGNIKIPQLFDANKANFNPALKDANEFKTKGLEFAKNGAGDIYIDYAKGASANKYPLLKIDPKTFEYVGISEKGTVINYNQTKGLPTAKQMLVIPAEVYK
ncbi:MAG: hypothetical protein U0457_07070 [Candidatus Sericytochromatia bacterium]